MGQEEFLHCEECCMELWSTETNHEGDYMLCNGCSTPHCDECYNPDEMTDEVLQNFMCKQCVEA